MDSGHQKRPFFTVSENESPGVDLSCLRLWSRLTNQLLRPPTLTGAFQTQRGPDHTKTRPSSKTTETLGNNSLHIRLALPLSENKLWQPRLGRATWRKLTFTMKSNKEKHTNPLTTSPQDTCCTYDIQSYRWQQKSLNLELWHQQTPVEEEKCQEFCINLKISGRKQRENPVPGYRQPQQDGFLNPLSFWGGEGEDNQHEDKQKT